MKLKKKTRKQLRRLSRAALGLGTAFATELLRELTATFAHERSERSSATSHGSDANHRSNGAQDRNELPRTADSH